MQISQGRALLAVAAAAAGTWLSLAPATAFGDGDCGRHDSSGRTACPIDGTHPTLRGTLVAREDAPYHGSKEEDWFVFHARAGTRLDIVLHDDENPNCDNDGIECGQALATLDGSDGLPIAFSRSGLGGMATVNAAGVPVAATIRRTIHRTGTYYIVVDGVVEINQTTHIGSTLPYSFTVSARPGVSWPGSHHHRRRRHR